MWQTSKQQSVANFVDEISKDIPWKEKKSSALKYTPKRYNCYMNKVRCCIFKD